VTPVIYVIYRSYRLYLGRLEAETTHARQMADLRLRTIEALALAIDAKDHTTHDHLQHVQVYAVEIAKELQVSEQEFEKMKIHPAVGAEILERVKFPYPVVPIVRAHHEKWNGLGYPDGLKGEGIPIGARIPSVPLEGSGGVLGVLAVYRQEQDSFSRNHLRIMQAVSPKLALSIENSLRSRQAETSATTDYLTGLANSRSLFVQLDGELARARRAGTSLTVLVGDLDGFSRAPEVVHYLGMSAVVASDCMRELLGQVERVARTNAAVLISGESGTGKELVARAGIARRRRRCWVSRDGR